ncbi:MULTISPECIES: cysteine/glutathione ABC transporter ATP-binding protein/permease CydC [Pantoea]|uniref:heme ABC transporter ATP-binding protein/permease CydC n=1 Tax=Pantoea TaxID=53335 RepID=UPI000999B2CE|nr:MULTISPECIES: cysteine/glutathione ABC transporter ATP-binding protein/permease CydC [Pantoea]MCD2356589.1 cysteine/glutathione ABC transporter ATP-binding protein/permease CydC [Pantoea sp. MHSD4]PQL28593.1 cysteine/glutathione ABC transporter ATP-binding protein/permease CydC [Pantoea ananatis]SJZ32563.1 ATP-binding cassette, subfamily C, CydC [Pantoea eucalypti]
MSALRPFLRLWLRHPFRLTLGIVLAIVTLLASIGLLTLSGWFLAASSVAGVAGLYTFNYMLPAAGVRGAAIIRTAARYAERLVSHDATFRVLQHLRVHTFSRLMALSPGQLSRFRQADLLNRFVADVDTLDHLYLRVISPLLGAFIVSVVVTFGMSFINFHLALTLGGIMLSTLVLMPALFYRLGSPAGVAIAQGRAHWRLQLMQWLAAQAELTLYGASQGWRQQLDEDEQRWQQAQSQQQRLQAAAQCLLLLISGVTVTLLLWLSAATISEQQLPGSLIALVVFCALAAFEALAPVAGAFLPMSQVINAAQRVNDIIDQSPAITFPAHSEARPGPLSIGIDQLDFSYPDRPDKVLNRCTLSVAAGEHIALLGPTGCGKSTLLALLTRGWESQHGVIRLNDRPIREWSEPALRQRISVVTQRVHLFSQSLRDNLLLACPDASDEQLTRALNDVGLQRLLENQEGLNAWMGEGGRPLSGGELRRLALARALLHDGDLWLLDEPTEGLDATTEQHILTLLQQLTAGKTMIMVTHRLSGLELMDRICVMDNGAIVEQGSHAELISKAGRYWRFRQRIAL